MPDGATREQCSAHAIVHDRTTTELIMLSRFMPTNIGRADRGIRVLIGVALILLAVAGPKSPWGYLGILPLLTGLFGSCPFYSLVGMSTRRVTPR